MSQTSGNCQNSSSHTPTTADDDANEPQVNYSGSTRSGELTLPTSLSSLRTWHFFDPSASTAASIYGSTGGEVGALMGADDTESGASPLSVDEASPSSRQQRLSLVLNILEQVEELLCDDFEEGEVAVDYQSLLDRDTSVYEAWEVTEENNHFGNGSTEKN